MSMDNNLDLSAFLPNLDYMTPDGRWRKLQNWLDDNPDFKERIEDWAERPIDEVFPEIRETAACSLERQYGPLCGALVRGCVQMTPQLSRWIETALTCYKERAALDGMEDRRKKKSDGKRKRLTYRSDRDRRNRRV